VPQIEVTFEIDANGIVNVSAKDMATGNRQKITIQSPTNLSQDEINRMVKEAAVYAEEDARRREEAQVRNRANTEVDTAERTLRELHDQLTLEQVRAVRDAVDKLRSSLQTYDTDRIRHATEVMTDILYSITTEAYLSAGGPGSKRGATDEVEIVAAVDEPSEEDLFGWFKK